ncbi:MAG TPA: ATP-binding protein [Candidatus Saccharimonadales bacterium]|nr:ATP-binding protein [Candidatus Saccharimonadales bacterium]
MRLTPHNRDTFRYVVIGLMFGVAITSIIVAVALGRSTANDIHTQLSERSQSIAAALGSTQIATLKGTASDASTETYKGLKKQLADVKRANPDARSIYVIGQRGERLFFYVDSEQPSSSQYSPAGEWYDDGTDADSAMFKTGQPIVEGPVSDSYGTFISGLAPIFKPGTRDVLATIGIDVDASTYRHDIITSTLIPLLTGLSIVLILFVFESIRRRNLQLLALRSELVSVASHELRNPITGIRWASDSLRKMIQDDRAVRMANAIYNSAVALQATTDDILELTHAMNRRALNIQPVDMAKLMHEVIEVQTLSAQQKGMTIDMDQSWPPQLLIDCDADQIKRALHNVVSNAVKYGREQTSVTISYKQDDGMHQMLIMDQGIGIPEFEQAKVWHGFYRASNAVASNIPGTGLGLYLVKAVFEGHGGKVRFTSVQNQGTTLILSLPIHHRALQQNPNQP